MNDFAANGVRVLALDPSHKGFGFAVLEGSKRLIIWEVTEARTIAQVLKVMEDLIKHYEPDFLIVEDCNARGCRRGKRTTNATRRRVAG